MKEGTLGLQSVTGRTRRADGSGITSLPCHIDGPKEGISPILGKVVKGGRSFS